MEARLKVLDLFLSALGENSNISSLDDRLRVQKAVYLGQLFGVDLGYRYSWYLKGPYCTNLTQDYFELDQQREPIAEETVSLNENLKSKLEVAKSLLEVPNSVSLEKHHWFELLASLHYLYKVSRLPKDAVHTKMSETKSHLSKFIDVGEQRLRTFSLI